MNGSHISSLFRKTNKQTTNKQTKYPTELRGTNNDVQKNINRSISNINGSFPFRRDTI